jgi:PAS domain S-box-containing protein
MANSIVLRFDSQGTITYLNPFAEQFFGYASEELVGRPLLGTIVPD